MATLIRPDISGKNKYWIEKHRHYELKHFCLQYPLWKKLYSEIDGLNRHAQDQFIFSKTNSVTDKTSKYAEDRLNYFNKMKLVEQAAIDADPELANYILKGVTEGLSYPYLKSKLEIPCSRDTYYNRYRRFFWLLNNSRD